MKICIPASSTGGLTAPMSGHFGRAPYFALVDTESKHVEYVANPESGHAHAHAHAHEHAHGQGHEHGHTHGHEHAHGQGHCAAAERIAQERPEAVLASGIGHGAFESLRGKGIRVFRVPVGSVEEALVAHAAGRSVELDPSSLGCG